MSKKTNVLRISFRLLFKLTLLAFSVSVVAANAAPKDGQLNISDPYEWHYFNPKHSKGEVIPSAAVLPDELTSYKDGAPSFPHDPSRNSLIFGRGEKFHPTEIYAKAFDPVIVEGNPVAAPAAGRSLDIKLTDKSTVTIWGTTCYTPLSDTRSIVNVLSISPYDPNRIFYTSADHHSVVVYGEPDSTVMIMGRYMGFPAASATSQTKIAGCDITLVGILKGVPQPNLKLSKEISEQGESEEKESESKSKSP